MARVSRIKVRRSGAFSQRDMVGCEARWSPLSGRRPQASLKAGSLRRSSRSSASGYPQAMAKTRARRMSAIEWVIRSGSRWSGMIAANVSIRPSRLSAPAKSKTPPSELIRPPSNAAVIFFWQILGKANGRRVSSSVAGMADSVLASRVASTTNLYAIPGGCTMPVSESLLCGE